MIAKTKHIGKMCRKPTLVMEGQRQKMMNIVMQAKQSKIVVLQHQQHYTGLFKMTVGVVTTCHT